MYSSVGVSQPDEHFASGFSGHLDHRGSNSRRIASGRQALTRYGKVGRWGRCCSGSSNGYHPDGIRDHGEWHGARQMFCAPTLPSQPTRYVDPRHMPVSSIAWLGPHGSIYWYSNSWRSDGGLVCMEEVAES